MVEFNNGENPCKNCLIKSICVIPCDELDKFAKEALGKKMLSAHWYYFWLEDHECRPRVLHRDKSLYTSNGKRK